MHDMRIIVNYMLRRSKKNKHWLHSSLYWVLDSYFPHPLALVFFSIFFSSFLTFVHFNSIHGNVIIINFFFDQWNWLFPSTLVKSDLRWWFPVNPLLKIVMHSQRVNKKERGRKNYFAQKMQQKHIELQRDTNNIRLEDPISIKIRIFCDICRALCFIPLFHTLYLPFTLTPS